MLKILFVCTGNICRSPLAAQLLDAEIARLASEQFGPAPVRSVSRGTQAVPGAPMEAFSARQSLALGGDPADHLSRSLRPADLDAADLVVTMTLEHRADVARMRPTASKKAVTLLELARLLEHCAAEHCAAEPGLTAAAADLTLQVRLDALLARRNAVPPPRRQEDLSIPDPFGRSAGAHVRAARQILAAVVPLAVWLAASGPAGDAARAVSTQLETPREPSAPVASTPIVPVATTPTVPVALSRREARERGLLEPAPDDELERLSERSEHAH